MEGGGRRPRPWGQRPIQLAAAVTVAAACGLATLTYLQVRSAARAGQQAFAALERAQASYEHRDFDRAKRELARALELERRMRNHLGGPALKIVRPVPLVGTHLEAADALAKSSEQATLGRMQLVEAGRMLYGAEGRNLAIVDALPQLERVSIRAKAAVRHFDAAADVSRGVRGKPLIGRLARLRDSATRDVEAMRARGRAGSEDLVAVLHAFGAHSTQRYLFLSQNPDELRPTGGFIGTYGVLRFDRERPKLERYASIESWFLRHPEATVPVRHAPSALRLGVRKSAQTIANVNATPDWPASARLAQRMWARGGEKPVDGVLTFTPRFLSRILHVIGPVRVSGYRRTVDEGNVEAVLDHYTHAVPGASGPKRKRFVSALAHAVAHRLRSVRVGRWEKLGAAVKYGFDAREAMMWSEDPPVRRALERRGWQGTLPAVGGDFFYNAEFQYGVKNGSGLRRTFDHLVELRTDGSARMTTAMTVVNTWPKSRRNPGSHAYVTLYAPRGAKLDPRGSDAPAAPEPAVGGHPAAGWFINARPLRSTRLRVAWNAPAIALPAPDGDRDYRLWWMHVPAHRGDVLRLRVVLPRGWRWAGSAPPRRYALSRDLRGSWRIATNSGDG